MTTGIPVIAVFDIGKTNKKLLLFDECYTLLKEEVTRFEEIVDDDNFPCEDLEALTSWIMTQFCKVDNDPKYQLRAVNFSTYGASLVHVDKQGNHVGYLYNYLKPYPDTLKQQFCEGRKPIEEFSVETGSPIMGHLNAGLQLYWIKYEKPVLFNKILATLHFPQYLSFLFTGKKFAEMTNVGCHSAVWNFAQNQYHSWLSEENLRSQLSEITPGSHVVSINKQLSGNNIAIGIGLHDSSAAMIPYLESFTEPFMILSTGTWAISLNPFNNRLPNKEELSQGCVSYLTYLGKPVKVSMLFAGNDHEEQALRIAGHFKIAEDFYKIMVPDHQIIQKLLSVAELNTLEKSAPSITGPTAPCGFHLRNLSQFQSAAEAYHQLIIDLVNQQKIYSEIVLVGSLVKNLYVDGGFSKNELYMQLLASAFPDRHVYASSMVQGTALGAALALHQHWNKKQVPSRLVQLKRYLPIK